MVDLGTGDDGSGSRIGSDQGMGSCIIWRFIRSVFMIHVLICVYIFKVVLFSNYNFNNWTRMYGFHFKVAVSSEEKYLEEG